MKFFLAHIFVRRKTKDSVRVFTKTLRFVQSQELEISTFVVFQLQFQFSELGGGLSLPGR